MRRESVFKDSVSTGVGMKILVLADIHANWPALSAVTQAETFDECLVLGDLVEYGGQPSPCIDWVREHATLTIRGNHDHGLVQQVPSPPGGSSFRRLAGETRVLNYKQLRPSQLKFLSRLPVTATTRVGEQSFYLVHATPRDPMDEYLPPDPVLWTQRLQAVETDFACVGHTHIPMHLRLREGLQLINPGSVGQPRDGDPRAAYAVIEDGVVSLRRIPYDIDAAVAGLVASGLSPELLEVAEGVLRRGGKPTSTAG